MHVGALKEAAAARKAIDKDRSRGHVRPGYTQFPPSIPVRALPWNVVIQKGKPRLTIDPSMDLEPDNQLVDPVNDVEQEGYPELEWVRVTDLARAAAILLTARFPVKAFGLDGTSYYRRSAKQRMDRWRFTLLCWV